MIVALPPEHRRNFIRLQKVAEELKVRANVAVNDARAAHACCLMRFYSVESGLKYLLSVINKTPMRYALANGDVNCIESFGHDLKKMIMALKVPAAYAPNIGKSFSLAGGHQNNGGNQIFTIGRAHEAWRYGLVIVENDQQDIERCLLALSKWIEEHI